ncbi:MAG TPA: efflux RND transporter periplasmic adaptor subunit [Candidatus Omnitrophota bacterium]|nr:efflux RND transporter periplasmic adaptor subunit [Candidatus Omnitrophota bacterium]HNQ50032.1 efflux RND transporter periplasmic adaptor subunit [Candidatus Omnitrophota bacterium]HQO37784.1 efflux RND transporter periplasmic adaptor subunit [Candidatus Omnitrophota bacterium]HQQ05830.1 efflux RND transporter periplasmic adaptor subunit [Candidatus Omnitrophota bacterium]
MKRMRAYRSGFVIALAGILLLCGCQKKETAVRKASGSDAIPVKVATVKADVLQEYIDYVANVKAREETQVFPRVTGKIIEKVKQEGDSVAKGETIAWIDRDEVGLTFEKSPVESPIAGIVARINVDIGANVSPQAPIGLVVNMDKVKVFLDVPEKYLPALSVGMSAEVTVEAYPDEIFKGTIARMSPIVDTATRTCQIEIGIDNKGHRLRSGMYAKVKVVIREYKDALVLLKEAVLGKAPQQYVYVVTAGKAHLRDVRTGVRQGPYVQVLEGVSAGDKVVIMGQMRLREGVDVMVEENGLNNIEDTR